MTYILLIVFIALTTADAGLTIYGIRNGYRELNPILGSLMAKLGVKPALALTKIPVAIGAVYCVVVEQASIYFILALVIPYACLVVWNIYQIRKTSMQQVAH